MSKQFPAAVFDELISDEGVGVDDLLEMRKKLDERIRRQREQKNVPTVDCEVFKLNFNRSTFDSKDERLSANKFDSVGIDALNSSGSPIEDQESNDLAASRESIPVSSHIDNYCDRMLDTKIRSRQSHRSVLCARCHTMFKSSEELEKHFREDHGSNRDGASICKICHEYFPDCRQLLRHKKCHKGFAPSQPLQLSCYMCGEKFGSREQLKTHYQQVDHAEERVKCEVCGAMLKNAKVLRMHLSRHTSPEQSHACSHCRKAYRSAEAAKIHERRMHGEPSDEFVCAVCGKEQYTEKRLRRHVRVAHSAESFPCDECGKTYKQMRTMLHHKIAAHTVGLLVPQCMMCSKRFAAVSSLKKHMLSHDPGVEHRCHHCGKILKSSETLKQHVRQQHGGGAVVGRTAEDASGEKFQCEVCGKMFLRKSCFLRHRNTMHVLSGKGFECRTCRRAFRSEDRLQVHTARHDKGRRARHTCTTCKQAFMTRGDMRRHANVHTGVKSFACRCCNKCFARRDNLKTHVRSVHPNASRYDLLPANEQPDVQQTPATSPAKPRPAAAAAQQEFSTRLLSHFVRSSVRARVSESVRYGYTQMYSQVFGVRCKEPVVPATSSGH